MTLVEQIRPLLSARDPQTVQGATEIAAAYAAQCKAVNSRLARCSDYLRRGLRSEAVHLAEMHPNVLQGTDDLQMDPLDLERLYNSLSLVPPEEPNAVAIEDLRSASETEQSLASLLSMHRMLAVGRGTVRRRLAVLHALAQKDPLNPVWKNDIRHMEIERIKGIDREYKIAVRDSDLKALLRLGREISGTAWTKPLPREMVLRINKSAQNVRRQKRIATLNKLIVAMQTARATGDDGRCAKMLDQWQALTASSKLQEMEIPAELLNRGAECAQSMGAWLTSERRRRFSGHKNGERRTNGNAAGRLTAGQLDLHGTPQRSLLTRGLLVLVSPFRFLLPQRYRSHPMTANDTGPGFLRPNTGFDHNV